MAATLTEAMLSDLAVGNACIKLVEQTDTLKDTTFDNADEIFTTEGSLNITQADPTKTNINIDQGEVPIDTAYTAGDFTITGTVPSVAIALFDYFYNPAKTQPSLTSGITGSDGTTKYKTARGYNIDNKRKKCTIFIESESRQTAIVFMNVDIVTVINWGTVKTTPLGLNFTGTVLRNNTEGAPDFVILKSGAETPSPSNLSLK